MSYLINKIAENFEGLVGQEPTYDAYSSAYTNCLREMDYVWVKGTQIKLNGVRLALSGSLSIPVQAYAAAANFLYSQPVPVADPLTQFSDIGFVAWGDLTPYLDPDARCAAEVAGLMTAGNVGKELAGIVQEVYFRSDSTVRIENFTYTVSIPALIEYCSYGAEEAARGLSFIRSFDGFIGELPTGSLGKRPLYVVQVGENLESIAVAIYGDEARIPEMIRALQLSPPFIWPEYRAGCLYPGLRILLPNDADSQAETEAYGMTWALTVDATNDQGIQQWDLYATDGGMAEVAGLPALATELALRASQPTGDWPEVEYERYGVPSPIGGKVTSTRSPSDAFAIAAALLEDDRVQSVAPLEAAKQNQHGVVVSNTLVTPVPPRTRR